MKSVRLIDAARSGPVIVINCSERCCDALVIIPGQVTISRVHLPNFTKKKAQEARDKMETHTSARIQRWVCQRAT
ncbi:hypothetical protein AG1IA_10487 [Rhizoctonia solani AG-1 IA]|uniref:Uncharacterized protein n=1 Tax=Thanatephorus cucumeris (strain AG1-IA) TaxID=983506 RepID=L8WFC1_THACA|nr:hypothetical protein AG1IA_10487 [Rhizoctonia solani AG-1 IA]